MSRLKSKDIKFPRASASKQGFLRAGDSIAIDGFGTAEVNPIAINLNDLSGTLAVNKGGTNATTAAGARTNLGLVIGTDVQAHDIELDALATTVSAADALPYFTGPGMAATTSLTAAGRAILDDGNAAAQRATLGLGTMATQDANAVAVTGGTITGMPAPAANTDVVIKSYADGIAGRYAHSFLLMGG